MLRFIGCNKLILTKTLRLKRRRNKSVHLCLSARIISWGQTPALIAKFWQNGWTSYAVWQRLWGTKMAFRNYLLRPDICCFLKAMFLDFWVGVVLPKGFGVASSLLSGTDYVVPSFLQNNINGCLVPLQSILSLWSRPLWALSSIMLTQSAFILSLTRLPQLSRNIPEDESCPCGEAACSGRWYKKDSVFN